MKEEELDIIKSAYEKPSMFPETHVTSRSQGGRTEDRGLGSCTQMDVKYEFDTKEGLHVKLYRMAIIKGNMEGFSYALFIISSSSSFIPNILTIFLFCVD
jgi:hypothetical protein